MVTTIDPLGGSYYVEQLTDAIEAEAQAYIERIDALGGMVAAIEQGYVQREIESAAYAYGQSIEKDERIVVGVNKYQNEQGVGSEIFTVPAETARKQVEKLQQVKAGRDNAKVSASLKAIEAAAAGTENLMPVILEAVKAYASIGEICGALQKVFGEYTETFN
jgi:methylmalonyl-CoA mutase, N-terminal domain